ncbi:MAG TPA: hypothetical protein VGE72_31260 [Azospirillum sp.]
MIAEKLLQAACTLEDAGVPRDVLGRLYESFAQAALIQAGVSVDLMALCGFDNPAAHFPPQGSCPRRRASGQPLRLGFTDDPGGT